MRTGNKISKNVLRGILQNFFYERHKRLTMHSFIWQKITYLISKMDAMNFKTEQFDRFLGTFTSFIFSSTLSLKIFVFFINNFLIFYHQLF